MEKEELKKYEYVRFYDNRGRARLKALVICPDCGKERWVLKDNMRKAYFTARCVRCSAKANLPEDKHGPNNPNWRGGRIKTLAGYILRWVDKDDPYFCMAHRSGVSDHAFYVLEHRYVMAKKLGRPLKEWEHVHHLNGIKDDNRPENLEIVGAPEHFLITKMQKRIRDLEEKLWQYEDSSRNN